MPVNPTAVESVTRALDQIFEEGRLTGQRESQQQYFGLAAATLTAGLFRASLEAAAAGLRPHSVEAADFFHAEAERFRDFATPPVVASHDPADGVLGIVENTPIHVRFQGPIRAETLTAETFFIGAASGGPHLNATISYDPATLTATLQPDHDLSPGTQYKVTLAGVHASGGMPLEPPVTFTFTTTEP